MDFLIGGIVGLLIGKFWPASVEAKWQDLVEKVKSRFTKAG